MSNTMLATLLIVIAVALDVAANIFLKKSQGFKLKKYGAAAIVCVGLSFIGLAKSIELIELSVAYSLFGAIGLICTTFIDKIFFHVKIKPIAFAGVMVMIAGIVMIKI